MFYPQTFFIDAVESNGMRERQREREKQETETREEKDKEREMCVCLRDRKKECVREGNRETQT